MFFNYLNFKIGPNGPWRNIKYYKDTEYLNLQWIVGTFLLNNPTFKKQSCER